MNYHIMIDDKFIDGFIEDSETVSKKNNNLYFVNGDGNNRKYIKNNSIKFINLKNQFFINLIKNATKNDKIIVHWYDLEMGLFLLKNLSSDVPLYVVLWGGEFYEDPYLYHINWIHDKRTLEYVKKNNIVPDKYNRRPHLFLKKIWLKINYKKNAIADFKIKKKTIERINKLLLPIHDEIEVEFIKNLYSVKSLDFLPFNYDQNVDVSNDLLEKKIKKEKSLITIQIGNSATESNNHVDAFFEISHFNNQDIELFIPIAYGIEKYSLFVKKHGNEMFSNKIKYFENFIPRNEYIEILNKIDICIMYHNRQQAFGNCIPLLILGKKLFLKKENPLFTFFKSIGVVVFEANKIHEMSFEDFSKPLNENQKNENKKILKSLFSREKRLEYLKKILN